jgi:hypothetical protein
MSRVALVVFAIFLSASYEREEPVLSLSKEPRRILYAQ